MAMPAEAGPRGGEIVVGSEEILALTEVDNFKSIIEIYLMLTNGEEVAPDSLLFGYQEYMKNDPNGRATAEALDRLRANRANDSLFEGAWTQLSAVEPNPDGDGVFYELIGRTAAHLPPGLGAEILHDPRAAEEAA